MLHIMGAVRGALCLVAILVPSWAKPAYSDELPPNIVMVVVDDMQLGLLSSMPTVNALAREGITFDTARIQVALCGPSRSTLLTGRYAQNTAVYTNSHSKFYAAGNPANTFAVALQSVGYRTALIGKYINGYPSPATTAYIPPGWTSWFGRIASNNGDVPYDYRLNENGVVTSHGSTEADYATDVYFGKALGFIDSAVAASAPFFVMVSVHAPHDPSTPAPRHLQLYNKAAIPKGPAFNEADVSDKPSFIRDRKPFSSTGLATAKTNYRNRLRSLRAVDEGLSAILQRLASYQLSERTYVVFFSDNGVLFGEHRMMRSKGGPYEECNGVALVMRGPGIPAGQRRPHLVTNADLAATFADWAGAAHPAGSDGRSLQPLLGADVPDQDSWRQAIPLALVRNGSTPHWPAFYGLRSRDYMYAHYDTDERELYDLRTDPYELQNIAALASPEFLAKLDERALQLNACQGDSCRALEDEPVIP
ncbi:MAG: sulfatase [Geminicoccaceae bacterium]